MRYHRICALSLLGVISGCADDPTATVAPPQPSAAITMAADPLSKVNRLTPSLENKLQLFKADLVSKGYAIERGYWTLWGAEDCKYPLQTMGFCYGNNPTAPYLLAVLPQWKDEYSDQRTHHVLSNFQRNMDGIYRLDPQEALVVAAEMPPVARYFGLGSNVFSRETAVNENDVVWKLPIDELMRGILFATMPDPSRMMMIASIGNSINNVVITRQTGEPWQAGQQRFFVITPDADVAESVKAALLRAGVPSANDIFVEHVSPEIVKVGLGRSSDDLITYIRYAMPDDITAADEWRARLPLTVFRVRDMTGSRPANPFPAAGYDQRHWNFDETVLEDDLQSLAGAVRAHWKQPAAPEFRSFSLYTVFDLVGQHCLGYPDPARGPMNCIGDTQDADYQISPSMSLDNGHVIAVLGTLGTRTGNATYVSVSVNWFPQLVGVRNIDDEALDGTAAPFASSLQHDARLFYVHYIARDCRGLENCSEVSTRSVPVGEVLKVIQRNYVTPGYARGAEPTKILNPLAIVLDGTNRPATRARKGR